MNESQCWNRPSVLGRCNISITEMQNHCGMRWPFRKKAVSNKEEARRFYNAKDYEKAEPFLDAMLKENPNDAWAMDVLSRLYMNTENHRRAVPLLHRLIDIKGKEEILVKRLLHVATVSNNFDVVKRNIPLTTWDERDEVLMKKIVETYEDDPAFIPVIERWAEASTVFYLKLQIIHLNHLHFPSEELVEDFTSMTIPSALSSSEYILLLELCEAFEEEDLRVRHQLNHLNAVEFSIPEKRHLSKNLIQKGRNKEAILVVLSILESEPKDESSLLALTLLGSRTKQHDLVIEASRTLMEMGALELKASKRFAKAAIDDGDPATIISAMNHLAHFPVDYSGTLRQAFRACLPHADETSLELLESLCVNEVQRIDLNAIKTIHLANHNLALEIVDEGLEQYPDEVLLLHRKANILRVMGDVQGSIKACDLILEINPQHLKASILRTQMGTKIWDEDTAVSEYEKMVEAFPDCVRFHQQLLNYSYSAKRDMTWSKKIIEHGLTHVPNDLRLKLYKALVHAHLGEQELAQRTMKEILKEHPNSDNALITAAQVEKEIGNLDGQLAYVNRLLEKQRLSPLISKDGGKISPEYLGGDPLPAPSSIGRVSVIMTTYKRDPLLDVAIDSILNQTYADLELIVVDDCSPDDNFSYLEQRAAEEPRLRVFQMSQNGGTYLAKNFGMQQAKGDFFAFMDSDDYAHPQKIERQLETMVQHPTLQGVVHRCIRIDEFSNIEFRGVGPFRMSCISLLIRKEVVERMGYFDSLRVGADTEFIERIDAVFGKGSLLEAPELTLFMMRHSTSLTGGGPFHISWRSVAGPRLMHHTNFRMWHQQITQKQSEGYIPQHMSQRPFAVDESQKSTHFEWKEGMPLFSERIQSRHARWWSGQQDVWQKSLSAKLSGRAYVEGLGLKVPELYWSGSDIEALPEFSTLPSKFVLKPEEGWSSKNVYCMVEGNDILTHRALSRNDIVEQLNSDEFYVQNKPKIMIEELLIPEAKSVSDGIPRDYKFYCFGEKIALVHVALRKSEIHKEQNEHHYLTPNFVLMKEKVMKHRDQNQTSLERPDCWEEMIEAVQTIGKAVGIYMRIDMFATDRGAVFGEFTPTPHGGKGYSQHVDEYLAGFWHGEEGVA